ncbi:hypothetical protein L6452_14662 [Arctium lappa]|uniref:Uncharacterized protein n=1 Tax=Arctium lappa TaxID=4217 RepID=A0ACB9CLK8_ARCLA|nr:hypothetical protein L6452_14662 [Arctium lappa]
MNQLKGFLYKLIDPRPIIRDFTEKGFDTAFLLGCVSSKIEMAESLTKIIFIPPGVKREDVKVTLEGGMVVIKAEDSFTKKFNLPKHCNCNASEIKAVFIKDQVLKIYFPDPKGPEDIKIELK